MKKILCLILSAVMLFSLSGCMYESYELDEDAIVSDSEEYLDEIFPEESLSEEVTETEEITTTADETTTSDTAPPEETEETTTTETTTSVTETTTTETTTEEPEETANSPPEIDENGSYTSKDDVALYIHTYGKLPKNFISKKEAQALGWEGGSLEPFAPGKCIGGSHFGNYEGLLPEKKGRKYTECDIDTLGKSKRGAKRIVFSNDGLIYYTDDHYESFELLYGEE